MKTVILILFIVGLWLVFKGYILKKIIGEKPDNISNTLGIISFIIDAILYFSGIFTTGGNGNNNITTVEVTTSILESAIEEKKDEEIITITGESVTGKINAESEQKYRYFSEIGGVYRFELDIDDVNKYCDLTIYNEKNQELDEIDSDDNGISVELESNQTYTIILNSYEDDIEYMLNIRVPSKIEIITNNTIKDEMKYISQENQYIYHAPITGTYRIDFDINDVELGYDVLLYDKKNECLIDSGYYNEGYTIDLKKDEDYKLVVTQSEGLPQYSIKINVPNETEEVIGNVIKGKINFVDQKNIYNFSPHKTGIYLIKSYISNEEGYYNIIIKNSKNAEVFNDVNNSDGKEVELKKGKKYKIYIIYGDEKIKYTVKLVN